MTIFDSSTVYDKYVHFLLVDWYWSLMMSHPNQPQASFTSSLVFVILWQRKGFQETLWSIRAASGTKISPSSVSWFPADRRSFARHSFHCFQAFYFHLRKIFFSFWPLNLISDWTHSNISLFLQWAGQTSAGAEGGGGGDRGRGVSPSNWFSAQVFVESDFLIPLHHPPLEL